MKLTYPQISKDCNKNQKLKVLYPKEEKKILSKIGYLEKVEVPNLINLGVYWC